MPGYSLATVPPGDAIRTSDGRLDVPDRPIIPFIEGDGTGPDIWRASRTVFDAAVAKAYGGKREIAWMEVYAGEKAFNRFKDWLPEETVKAFKEFVVGIKGPLTTPVGGGIRSLNVTLRQVLDLYVCLRPVRYFPGVPSPVKRPEQVDMVIFRENTEDIYAGIEWAADSQLVRGQRAGKRPGLRPDDARPADEGPPRRRGGARPLADTWRREVEAEAPGARRHRRRHAPAGAHTAARLRRHRDAEPERRLPLRCARGPGGRHRHRPRRQHQLRERPRHLRGDARDGAQVRQPGQGEPGLGHPLRRDDVPPPRLGRGGRRDHPRGGGRDRGQDRDLRLPSIDGRCDAGPLFRVRAGDHRPHVGEGEVRVTGA